VTSYWTLRLEEIEEVEEESELEDEYESKADAEEEDEDEGEDDELVVTIGEDSPPPRRGNTGTRVGAGFA